MTRWSATIVCCGAIGALSQTGGPSLWTLALATIALVSFLVVCGTFGAFRRGAWIADDETSARLDAADIDARRHTRPSGGERDTQRAPQRTPGGTP